MFNLLLTLILSITTINSLDCMELVQRKTSKSRSADGKIGADTKTNKELTAKKRRNYRKSVSSSEILTKKPAVPITLFDDSEHAFIKAVRNKNRDDFMFYFSNAYFNPNIKNRWLNTAVHYAVLSRNEDGNDDILNSLFPDPRVDFSIKNKHGLTAHDLITGETKEAAALRAHSFIRYILSMLVNQKSDEILKHRDTKTLGDHANTVITLIKKDNVTQAVELPIEAQLPDYATPEFITKMFDFRLGILLNNQ